VETAEQTVKPKERLTFTDMLRVIFKDVLIAAGSFLHRLGIHPNLLTLTGLLGTALGAYFVSQGNLFLGGLLIIVMGPVDALDGAVARARGEPQEFGAFVDSVTDRYSELAIYAALLFYFLQLDDLLAVMLVFFAAAGSVLVSYIRARAQSLGYEAKVGILTRVERYFIVGPSLLFNIPLVGVAIVAVGANLTALQRILHVRRAAHAAMDKKKLS
jgi:CDP-diacylglycerol--glycerol-3-phosphate 3-phosphatidyltransferase